MHGARDRLPVLRHLDAPHGRVYLTFDDGPDAEWTPRVLDVLEAAGAKATFFVVGRAAERSSALLRRMKAQGHDIGNHTYRHRHPWMLSAASARLEVRDGAAAIAAATGQAPRLFRPPHGRLRRAMADEAWITGQRVVLWSLSAVDWGPFGREPRIAGRLAAVRAGDIVLLHDARSRINHPDETLRVLPGFLSRLASRGLVPSVLPRPDQLHSE